MGELTLDYLPGQACQHKPKSVISTQRVARVLRKCFCCFIFNILPVKWTFVLLCSLKLLELVKVLVSASSVRGCGAGRAVLPTGAGPVVPSGASQARPPPSTYPRRHPGLLYPGGWAWGRRGFWGGSELGSQRWRPTGSQGPRTSAPLWTALGDSSRRRKRPVPASHSPRPRLRAPASVQPAS